MELSQKVPRNLSEEQYWYSAQKAISVLRLIFRTTPVCKRIDKEERKAYLLENAHEVLEYAEIEDAVIRRAQLGIDLLYLGPSLQNLDESLEIRIFKITSSLRICLLSCM